MGTRTDLFRRLVRDHMRGGVVVAAIGTPCAEAIRRLIADTDGASSIVIAAADGRPLGIVTESDIVRRVVFQRLPETPVEEVMSAPLVTIRDDDYLFHAIAVMRRRGLRHMPVTDGDSVVGMLDLHSALAVASPQMMAQLDRLTHEETLEGMKEVKAAQVEVADELFRDDVPAPEIQALLSHIDRDLFARLTRLCLAEMIQAGRGEPPLPFALIVMGSMGRGESYVRPDQDFGMIISDYPDADHGRIDPWYIELGERLAEALDAVGFPYCKGGVMAYNPLWRKTISQWRDQVDLWIKKGNDNFIRLADIFFDFVPVYGDVALAAALRDHVTRRLKGNPHFLKAMYWVDDDRKVALGLFNRFITERRDKGHRGEINLKFTGTLPLVEAVRILALREGVPETSTLDRMAALNRIGLLDDNELDYLRGAYRHIVRLLLRQQIADFGGGRPVSNYVAPGSLSQREKELLVDSFKAISALLGRLRNELTGELF
jgi:signal-transduction protein with cAMP-binding, CBS, and nucleotidyltransferase domain